MAQVRREVRAALVAIHHDRKYVITNASLVRFTFWSIETAPSFSASIGPLLLPRIIAPTSAIPPATNSINRLTGGAKFSLCRGYMWKKITFK